MTLKFDNITDIYGEPLSDCVIKMKNIPPQILQKEVNAIKKAASISQSNIENCLVFEDSLPGMQAVIESGAWLIAVPHMVHVQESERVRSIKSLSELSFEKLKALKADFTIKI